jgi:protein O-GlcNAc transferase
LEPEFEKKFLQTLRKEFPNHKVQAIWFEKLNYAQQLQVIRNTDILIGAHGNGLTHSYFLPDNALVLEIFPNGAFAMDYQLISELAEHDYYAIEPKEGIISFAGHHMPPRGNVNQVIQEFDMNWVLSPIKEHIQEFDKMGGMNERSSLE